MGFRYSLKEVIYLSLTNGFHPDWELFGCFSQSEANTSQGNLRIQTSRETQARRPVCPLPALVSLCGWTVEAVDANRCDFS